MQRNSYKAQNRLFSQKSDLRNPTTACLLEAVILKIDPIGISQFQNSSLLSKTPSPWVDAAQIAIVKSDKKLRNSRKSLLLQKTTTPQQAGAPQWTNPWKIHKSHFFSKLYNQHSTGCGVAREDELQSKHCQRDNGLRLLSQYHFLKNSDNPFKISNPTPRNALFVRSLVTKSTQFVAITRFCMEKNLAKNCTCGEKWLTLG